MRHLFYLRHASSPSLFLTLSLCLSLSVSVCACLSQQQSRSGHSQDEWIVGFSNCEMTAHVSGTRDCRELPTGNLQQRSFHTPVQGHATTWCAQCARCIAEMPLHNVLSAGSCGLRSWGKPSYWVIDLKFVAEFQSATYVRHNKLVATLLLHSTLKSSSSNSDSECKRKI